jgi:hypothetical protein
LTNNILSLAPDYVGTTSYEIINNIYGNRLNIEDDKLILSTGLDVGTYYFSLRVSASGDNN